MPEVRLEPGRSLHHAIPAPVLRHVEAVVGGLVESGAVISFWAAVMHATPKLRGDRDGLVLEGNALRSTSPRSFSAIARAPSAPTSGSEDAELLAADAREDVLPPDLPATRVASCRRMASPARWPRVSLMFLKWSMSKRTSERDPLIAMAAARLRAPAPRGTRACCGSA